MKVKTKKQNQDSIVRLETSGEIKDVIINEDFIHTKDASVALCFRGKSSSGIVKLSPKEIEMINKRITPKLNMLGDIKVLKFEK